MTNPESTQDISDQIDKILPHFVSDYSLASIIPLGSGNINDTYLVEFNNHDPFVLQRVNNNVFPDPSGVCDNIRLVTEHISRSRRESDRKTLRLLPEKSGKSSWCDERGNHWRMAGYIAGTTCIPAVGSEKHAYETGAILGWFHRRLDDCNGELMVDPLPGFHDLDSYCREYQRVRNSHNRARSTDLNYCCQQADKRLSESSLLQDKERDGIIRKRIIHGDPKISNILFDENSNRATALIDLDTVAMGLLQFDLGDCLRSCCNQAGEDPLNPGEVRFDLDICARVLNGYSESGAALAGVERQLLYQGIRLLTYELAVRFLTDYLNNDRYFKVTDSKENLRRALCQFHLLDSIEQQRTAIQRISSQL